MCTETAEKLDQFYTNKNVAKKCMEHVLKKVPQENRKFLVEPSAGTGSFSDLFVGKHKCFDLDPQRDYIEKRDFFTVSGAEFESFGSNEICIIGNPPFGKNASVAVKFFNHAAEFADTICFVVPKTFKKQSIKNRLNLNFHLVFNTDLDKNSFIYNGEAYDVPCVFQIWKKKDTQRRIVRTKNSCTLFKFVKKVEADFAVRRVGGRSGMAFADVENLSEQSNHFCKITGRLAVKDVIKIINEIDFSKTINSTAGVRSLSKGELIRAIERSLKNENNS